jgi:CHAD domain-containing protein
VRIAKRELGELAEVLGEQRKYDVALADAARFRRKPEPIRARLVKAREGVRRALGKRGRRLHLVHLERALRDWNRVSATAFVPRLEKLRNALERAGRRPPRSNRGRHRLRLEVKKARYVLELAGRKIPSLKSMQEHLGRWHDLVVLADLTGETRGLVAARNKEWRCVTQMLSATIRVTARALKELAKELGR